MKIYKRWAALAVVFLGSGIAVAVFVPGIAWAGVSLGYAAGTAWMYACALPTTDRLLATWEPNMRKVDKHKREHGW